jgi:uncharacterized protein
MFREMRRKKQQLSEEACQAVLRRGTSGVLAAAGDDDYPYAVPVSYVYADGCIYFHSARTGHKMDAIARSPKVSFCVIDLDQVIPKELTTYYRSVIAFGQARILEDPAEKRAALEKLGERYSPVQVEGRRAAIEKEFNHLHMVEIRIEHLTGKEAIELITGHPEE